MINKSRDNKAVWSRDISIIFYDLCIREVELGNRPSTHFNKEGWNNVINGFKEKTGRAYGKAQLKSRWDNIKKDWKLWKELKQGSTCLGWSNIKNTIDAPDEWWNEKLQVLPAAKRFRYSGIDPELEEKLDQMYSGVVAMGLHARSAGMDNPPPPPTRLDVDDEQSEGDIRGSPFEGDDGVGPSAPSTYRVPSTSLYMDDFNLKNQDKLILRGLQFYGFHGVHAEEKKQGQKFLVDIDAWLDLSIAGETDDIADTVSYTDIYRIAKEIMEGPSQNLLESVAHRIANTTLLKYPQIHVVRVKVGKPDIKVHGPIDYLGVEILRSRFNNETK